MISVAEAKRRLADSIRNEKREYNQCMWKLGDQNELATCGTACCIAGHIEAIFRPQAKRLVGSHTDNTGYVDHVTLARDIWKTVTGKTCRFDFSIPDLPGPIGREEAVAHIYGRLSEDWPLLDPKQVESEEAKILEVRATSPYLVNCQ
jgi:hypothetical protein